MSFRQPGPNLTVARPPCPTIVKPAVSLFCSPSPFTCGVECCRDPMAGCAGPRLENQEVPKAGSAIRARGYLGAARNPIVRSGFGCVRVRNYLKNMWYGTEGVPAISYPRTPELIGQVTRTYAGIACVTWLPGPVVPTPHTQNQSTKSSAQTLLHTPLNIMRLLAITALALAVVTATPAPEPASGVQYGRPEPVSPPCKFPLTGESRCCCESPRGRH